MQIKKNKSPFQILLLISVFMTLVSMISCKENKTLDKEIKDSNPSINKEIINPDEVSINDVPFSLIEVPPVFPGCEEFTSNSELKDCFKNNIRQNITSNFNKAILIDAGYNGVVRIPLQFKINYAGIPIDLYVNLPNEVVVQEVKRVVDLIPRMKPGVHKGQKVNVVYAISILFDLEN